MLTAEAEEKYHLRMKSEERRAIIWLAYFAIAVALRIEYERALAIGQRPFLNILCSYPCPHVTIYLVETLNGLIVLWFLYTICILLYFSEDWGSRLWGKNDRRERELFRRLANFCMLAYPVWFGTYIIVGAISYFVPDQLQSPYWLGGLFVIGYVAISLVELVTGRPHTVRRLAEADIEGAHIITEIFLEGVLPLLERLAKLLLRGRTPPKIRRLWVRVKQILERRKRVKLRPGVTRILDSIRSA